MTSPPPRAAARSSTPRDANGGPRVSAGCVHARSPLAACVECLEACPHGALDITARGVTIDIAACDGCGICAAVCPEAAIASPLPSRPYRPRPGARHAFAACARIASIGEQGYVTCLHALGLRDLQALADDGVETLNVAAAPCADCDRFKGDRLAAALADLDRLMSRSRSPAVSLTVHAVSAWRAARDDASRLDRRALLRAFLPRTAETAQARGPAPEASRTALARFAPVIDAARCTACDACVRLCAHEAIVLAEADCDRSDRYVAAPARCTGCRLCEDACTPGAMHVAPWPTQAPAEVALVASQCIVCGNSYRASLSRPKHPSRCHVCSAKDGHAKLFQVLP